MNTLWLWHRAHVRLTWGPEQCPDTYRPLLRAQPEGSPDEDPGLGLAAWR